MPRDQEGTRIKGWIQSNVRFGPVSDIKFAITTEDTVLKFMFNPCLKNWIRIVNGIDKFVREAMPIHEKEKASGKPAAKARPSGWWLGLQSNRDK